MIGTLDVNSERSHELLSALIRADPSRAAELVARSPSVGVRFNALVNAVTHVSALRPSDLLPSPGRHAQLPDFEARYRNLLEALEAADLNETDHQAILVGLNLQFAPVVREAQEAVADASGTGP